MNKLRVYVRPVVFALLFLALGALGRPVVSDLLWLHEVRKATELQQAMQRLQAQQQQAPK